MARTRPPLPAWIAPATAVGALDRYRRTDRGVEVTFAIPVAGGEASVSMTVPWAARGVTELAVALDRLAKVLNEHRDYDMNGRQMPLPSVGGQP